MVKTSVLFEAILSRSVLVGLDQQTDLKIMKALFVVIKSG